MKKVNKTNLILEYLKEGNTLTPLEANIKFGTGRLGSIIFGLRKKYEIETEIIKVKDMWGNDCPVTRYSYKGVLNEN